MSKTVWANALLSDWKILFWYTGSRCDTWQDFYKDFYHSHMNMDDYVCNHRMDVARIGFVDETEDEEHNHLSFGTLATDFYRQYEISPDSKGRKPYGEDVPFVPPLSEQL